MGVYYDVEKVRIHGRELEYKHFGLMPEFENRLVAVLRRLVREVAIDVTDPDEYSEIYGAYQAGDWLDLDLYDFDPACLEEQPRTPGLGAFKDPAELTGITIKPKGRKGR